MNNLQPLIMNPDNSRDQVKINKYIISGANVIDAIDEQIEELFCIRNPNIKEINSYEFQKFESMLLKNSTKSNFGTWVYYPWNHCLVHLLKEEMYTEIRTARNRNLITKEEQAVFYNSTVAVAGLSVGNSAASAVVYAGGSKNMRLADFDVLSLSNLNRIRSSVINIGAKKTNVIAKEILEINPYAKLQLYSDGLNDKNIEEFLLKPVPVSVLIEEMDNLYLKIQIRLVARRNKIPIIMVTDNGDNIIIDIERYDLNPSRRLFNTDIAEDVLLNITKNTSKFESARIISQLVGVDNIADRMMESLLELGKSLYSWPQLGTAATIGGCVMSYLARKIVLGESAEDGKYILSLDKLLLSDYTDKTVVRKREMIKKEFKGKFNVE